MPSVLPTVVLPLDLCLLACHPNPVIEKTVCAGVP